jgi:Bacterial protein of unknown function (DUF885)
MGNDGTQRDGARTPIRWDPRDDDHLAAVWRVRPEAATLAGASEGLATFGSAAPEARGALVDALVSWRRALEAQAPESADRMLDTRVFATSLELFRFSEAEIGLQRRDADLASAPFMTLLYHLRGHVPLESQRFEALAKRLRGLDGALASGRAMVDSPSIDLLARARDVLDGGPDLLRAIDEAAQKAQRSGAIAVGLAAELHEATAAAGAALDAHAQWMGELSPVSAPPIDAARYNELLRLRGLDLRTVDVLDLARSGAEELRVEELRMRRRAYKGAAPDAALAQARRATPNSLGEAMSWLQELVRESRQFLGNSGALPVPEPSTERIVVDVMPSVLAASGLSAIALPPQPLAPLHETLLLVREAPGAVADALPELSVADLENVTASLGYPGFHLQQVWAARSTTAARAGVMTGGLSPIAATWGQDMVLGWGHTCEELMRELAFRHSPASRLIMIRRALASTLLAAVDVSLHTGRLAPEQAATFLVRRAGLRLPVARAVVRSLLRAPTQGVSGFIGKIRIEQLRREAHKVWRDGYTDKRFTTLLLTAGPVPLAYLFERLNAPTASAASVIV